MIVENISAHAPAKAGLHVDRRQFLGGLFSTGAFVVVAVTANPAGAAVTKSPWLAQTRSSDGIAANNGAPGSILIVARPNSFWLRSGQTQVGSRSARR